MSEEYTIQYGLNRWNICSLLYREYQRSHFFDDYSKYRRRWDNGRGGPVGDPPLKIENLQSSQGMQKRVPDWSNFELNKEKGQTNDNYVFWCLLLFLRDFIEIANKCGDRKMSAETRKLLSHSLIRGGAAWCWLRYTKDEREGLIVVVFGHEH